jgi:hypothetical protein
MEDHGREPKSYPSSIQPCPSGEFEPGEPIDAGAFYLKAEGASFAGTINYLQASAGFYLVADPANSIISVGIGSSTNWYGDEIPLKDQLKKYKAGGYVEVEHGWLVHKENGTIKHICNGGVQSMMELNKVYYSDWLCCEECNKPVPNKPFFLSEALR